MNTDTDFPTKIQTVDDLPEPLRHVLKDNIPPNEQARLIIYSPLFSSLDDLSPAPAWPVTIFAPATVLAVLKNGWVVVTDGENGIEVENSKFSDTLFLELTSILLSGELKIHFASVGTYYSTSIPFNTVREELYREAIGLILNGIDQTVSVKSWPNNQRQPLLQTWPMKFRLEAERYRPNDQSLITATRWNAVTGGFERELSPAGALLVTSRSLISLLEQKAA
ncbi:MAG: hypothetical protein WAK31_25165, partial [Chthoniobacterales bacterium]